MIRRTFAVTVFIILGLAFAAAPAFAYGPWVGFTVFPEAQLAHGADPAVVVAAHDDGGTFSLQAHLYTTEGGPQPDRTVVSGVSGLAGWYTAGDGSDVTVAWKAGSAIFAKTIDLSDGSTLYGPVTVCTDAAVAALPGAATTAALSGLAPDGAGGVYVWCTVTPTTGLSGVGDSLLNHVSAGGALAVADPGLAVAKGTVTSLDVDDDGHAFALLAPPGRSGIAAQRFSAAMTADSGWSRPIPQYSPLLPVPNAVPKAIGITAGSGAIIAWRENAKVKAQRYPAGGGVSWLYPPAVTMAGDIKIAQDGAGGIYLVGSSTGGVVARHILSNGVVSASSAALGGLGLGQPRVGALTVNRAGDLFVGYDDAAVPALAPSGVGLMTCLGAWSTIGPSSLRPDLYSAAVPDGAGGAYLLGDATPSGVMWHLSNAGAAAVTFRPRSDLVAYGKSVPVAGYATQESGAAASGVSVAVSAAAGGGAAPTPVQTGADGYYHASITPKANATWTATAAGVQGDQVVIRVMPRLTLALSHLKPVGTRLVEILSGSVAPAHAGRQVLIQKAVGSRWSTVARGRLSSSSRYQVKWALPFKTATYKLRAVLPKHADHAEGASPTATLRVVIRKG